MSTDETPHAAMPTLLDMTKLPVGVIETVLLEVHLNAKAKQAAVDAIQADNSLSRADKTKAQSALLDRQLRWFKDAHNENVGGLGEHLHGAAHQMIDRCNKVAPSIGSVPGFDNGLQGDGNRSCGYMQVPQTFGSLVPADA
jgi:hypothetical protein